MTIILFRLHCKNSNKNLSMELDYDPLSKQKIGECYFKCQQKQSSHSRVKFVFDTKIIVTFTSAVYFNYDYLIKIIIPWSDHYIVYLLLMFWHSRRLGLNQFQSCFKKDNVRSLTIISDSLLCRTKTKCKLWYAIIIHPIFWYPNSQSHLGIYP